MLMPSHFLPHPALQRDEATAASFEHLFASLNADKDNGLIHYTVLAPKWQFLCWLTDTKQILLHGSGDESIEEFEPRQSNDIEEFGNRSAVYAASDGLWPIYYAILDRKQHPMSLLNACFRATKSDGSLGEPFYFFSISRNALDHQPWHQGYVYLLPRQTFEQQPPLHQAGRDLFVAQWASLVPVKPLGHLAVGPEDFPFLAEIRGHDDAVIWQRAAADPAGFPWLDEEDH